LTKNGRWTSAYGDEHADLILNGTIPFEVAKQQHGSDILAMNKFADVLITTAIFRSR
jgi:hypothetical protein